MAIMKYDDADGSSMQSSVYSVKNLIARGLMTSIFYDPDISWPPLTIVEKMCVYSKLPPNVGWLSIGCLPLIAWSTWRDLWQKDTNNTDLYLHGQNISETLN